MSKTSLIVGVAVSLLAHAVIFAPQMLGSRRQANTLAEAKRQAVVMLAQAQTEPIRPQLPKLEEPVKPPTQLKPPAKVEEVIKPRSAHDPIKGYGDLTEDDGDLPAMRIVWTGPEQVRSVARAFRMRIVAINVEGKVVGEVTMDGEARLVAFNGGLGGYSNRVRTLPADFFGRGLTASAPATIRSLWILVPAHVDKEFVRIQRAAIRERGVRPSAVLAMEARFAPDASGQYRLVVTRADAQDERRVNHG